MALIKQQNTAEFEITQNRHNVGGPFYCFDKIKIIEWTSDIAFAERYTVELLIKLLIVKNVTIIVTIILFVIFIVIIVTFFFKIIFTVAHLLLVVALILVT